MDGMFWQLRDMAKNLGFGYLELFWRSPRELGTGASIELRTRPGHQVMSSVDQECIGFVGGTTGRLMGLSYSSIWKWCAREIVFLQYVAIFSWDPVMRVQVVKFPH